MYKDERDLGRRLVVLGIITQAQLDDAVLYQQTLMGSRKLSEVLALLGYIDKNRINEELAVLLGIPIIGFVGREISRTVLNIIGASIATLYRVVPVEERGDALIVATSDPMNVNALDNLSRLLGRPVETVMATPEAITEALRQYYTDHQG